jgi:RND superfamily putative drug exporter
MVVVNSARQAVTDPAVQKTIAGRGHAQADTRVRAVVAPQAGMSISKDGHTAIIQAGAAKDSNTMVRAADDLKTKLHGLQADGVQVSLTGASGMWSDFNTANREAMMKSELISWPVTLIILVLAFGSLVAAGLPLMLTILGLMASAGSLYLGTQVLDISIGRELPSCSHSRWASTRALHRLPVRGALFSSTEGRGCVGETMDTAGKAVLFSGLTVLIALTAVMLVPSPAFRSMALGIMISVLFILAATLTLLPAVLGKLGSRVDKLSLPWVHQGEHRSARFQPGVNSSGAGRWSGVRVRSSYSSCCHSRFSP